MEQYVMCPFCNPAADEIVLHNDLCYARWDKFPVNKGHLLVIPFRHTPDFFTLTSEERAAVDDLVVASRQLVDAKYTPAGYNIGFNVGLAAGQTILHCHCHVIPRYAGDVAEPRGGVRGVVPGMRGY